MNPEILQSLLQVSPRHYERLQTALALYYFDNQARRVNQVLQQTLSGGVTVNDCLFHLGQHNLPFCRRTRALIDVLLKLTLRQR